jgi:hypothetical protein
MYPNQGLTSPGPVSRTWGSENARQEIKHSNQYGNTGVVVVGKVG